MRDLVREWRDNREWLLSHGYSEDLDQIMNELSVIRGAIMHLECVDDYAQSGIAALIKTVSGKLEDMASGRTSGDRLPQ
jgi:hypothetical protein